MSTQAQPALALTARPPHLTDVSSIDAHKESAHKLVREHGLPSRPLEVFKYTDTAALNKRAFISAAPKTTVGVPGLDLDADAIVLNVSGPAETVALDGVRVTTLNEAFARSGQTGGLAPGDVFYDGDPKGAGHMFWALNDAQYEGGVYIHITASQSTPLHLVSMTDGEDAAAAFPKVFIDVDAGVRAEIVEHHLVRGGGHLVCAMMHIRTQPGAHLSHHLWPEVAEDSYFVHAIRTQQHETSTVKTEAMLLGAGTLRCDIDAALVGEGARFETTALKVGRGAAHFDTQARIDHRVPACVSRQLERGILQDQARSVFNGRIYFQPDAQRSDTAQLNNNLLLSDDAEVDTKPQLEIFADDVKASHGATVGQLDEDSLFYLRARGISEREGRHMLVSAFAAEVVADIETEALRTLAQWRVDAAVDAVLAGQGA